MFWQCSGLRTNCWSEADERNFFLRGATYLQDRVKVQTGPPMCTLLRVRQGLRRTQGGCVGFNWLK